MKIQDAIKSYLSFPNRTPLERTNTVDLIITNLSEKLWNTLDSKEKEVVALINEEIVRNFPCSKHPEWVKPFRFLAPAQARAQIDSFIKTRAYAEKKDPEIDAAFELHEWEFHPSHTSPQDAKKWRSSTLSIEKIRSFIRGNGKILDLEGLELTSLPKVLFVDTRFQNTLLQENPLKRYPKNLSIGQIQNDKLFDKMASIISSHMSHLTQELFSSQGFMNSFNAFTKLSQDTAVDRRTSEVKNAQYEAKLRSYELMRVECPSFECYIPKELEDLIRTGTFLKTCVKSLAICEKRQEKDRNLIIVFHKILKKLPAKSQESWKQKETWSQEEVAKKMREFLQKKQTDLAKIEELVCKDEHLTEIPPEIALLTNLKILELSKNYISVIPPEIGALKKLAYFHLENNQITHIPPEIASLTNLERLDCENNEIRVIPPEIASLVELTSLNLAFNEIATLPPEIGSLKKLIYFYLEGNQISLIPSTISSLINLERLYLSDNQIEVLPPEIYSCIKLHVLFLANNKIKKVSKKIEDLVHLKKLHLRENGFSDPVAIQKKLTKHLPHCQEIMV
jgi:Leucine-rich repeat (LRR) protein